MSRFGWYRPWLSALQDDEARSRDAKAIGAVLARLERDGVIRETAAQLGAKASIGGSTARRALDELDAAGWLDKRQSRYCIVITLTARTLAQSVLSSQNGRVGRPEDARSERQDARSERQDARSERPLTTATELLPPVAPQGARQRDRERYREDVAVYAAQLFGDEAPASSADVVGAVNSALSSLDGRGVRLIAAVVRDEARFWLNLEPDLPDDHRDRIRVLAERHDAFEGPRAA